VTRNRPVIAVIEREGATRALLSLLLTSHRFDVLLAGDVNAFLALRGGRDADAVVLGPSNIESDGRLDSARRLRQILPGTPMVLVPAESSEDLAITALRAGINEYVKDLSCPEDVILCVERCIAAGKGSPGEARELNGIDRMIGQSAAIREIKRRLAMVAPTESNVLITGETGTGKELIAESLHQNGPRRNKPFIAINCAAIPDALFESELFGYERGAFTGAHQSKDGRLKAADGGTVFLDEIGDMSSYSQSKMLRMIESREVQRIGSHHGSKVDIRIIAATNRNLEKLVADNGFRNDLYFRLAVTSIHLPPLRERKEDLPPLLDYYLHHFNRSSGRSVPALSEQAMDCLLAYDWPGNIRELKNLVEAIFVELPQGEVTVADLPRQFQRRCACMDAVSQEEQDRLVGALLATNWNKSKAASRLRWSRMTLYRKMARYNIQRT
jgi:DNA-binding NtrC family response regulator